MKCPLVITPDGKLIAEAHYALGQSIRQMRHWLDKTGLRPTKYFMNQADWDDIVKWGTGSSQ